MNIDPYYHQQKYRPIALVSGNVDICRYSKAFLAGTSLNLSAVVDIDQFALFRCHIFVSFRNNGFNCTLRQHTVLDSCRHQ